MPTISTALMVLYATFGGQRGLARRIGVSKTLPWLWSFSAREIPAEQAERLAVLAEERAAELLTAAAELRRVVAPRARARREAWRRNRREAFRERFGHLPDEDEWGRREPPAGR